MKQYLITFRSVTYAQRGERSLGGRGISGSLSRTPKWMEQQGCGYGLTLRGANIYRAVDALRQDGLSWRWVYVLENGKYQEIAL